MNPASPSSPHNQLHCDEVQQQLGLLLYGELSFDQEEALQSHLDRCDACRQALATEQALHAILQSHIVEEPAADLLVANRRKLQESIALLPVVKETWLTRASRLVSSLFEDSPAAYVWRPIAALTLVAAGFFGGRLYAERGVEQSPLAMIAGQPVSARVRQVEADGSGMLQLVVDETRQRVISGRAEEEPIRRLLLSAAVDPSDAGLRGESVEILRTAAPCDETRAALVSAVLHDSNDGVRLRALEGLKPYATQPEVRRALGQVLLRDANSGVRTQTIDVLTSSHADMNTEIHIVSVFQELMRTESNNYIRMQCQRKLRELKASDEVY